MSHDAIQTVIRVKLASPPSDSLPSLERTSSIPRQYTRMQQHQGLLAWHLQAKCLNSWATACELQTELNSPQQTSKTVDPSPPVLALPQHSGMQPA
ncbi:Interleukin-12 receptor subunit beta-2 [Clarias magur]|uniref:Interleukin-12 receptor subunit beta-2 n=1 Tax=Clarias magur TaxID=1594786 RepID=A0A8J4UCA1_CLAMG|nr:Interleukin-12 receptor subunit beta-2 [Clarias magur]